MPIGREFLYPNEGGPMPVHPGNYVDPDAHHRSLARAAEVEARGVVVRVPATLRNLTGGAAEVLAVGTTVGELVADLDANWPGFRHRLIEPTTDTLRRFVNIYVNDNDVRFLNGLDTAVTSSDVLAVLPAVSGG